MSLHQNSASLDAIVGRGIGRTSDASGRWTCDPLEDDQPGDRTIVTTSRRLLRLAIAASDAGATITRDRLACDPAAWMIAPRMVFGGRAPIDAVQDLADFRRSVLLHGLGFGLDADPREIDGLLAEEIETFQSEVQIAGGGDGPQRCGTGTERSPRPRLLSCWVRIARPEGHLFAFCAMVTDDAASFVESVVGRYGAAAVGNASFRTGFDHTTPLATAMISDAMADTLALAAADPESPLATGLDVVVEQRFLA